jgi:DNA-binding beta-propeller fold protein YncE
MRHWAIILTLAAALEAGQLPEDLVLRHLYTFGSKEGIHPPKFVNRKVVRGAVGNGDHPYGLASPVAVTTDMKRRVWITDHGTASVHIFDRSTGAYKEIHKLADAEFKSPAGITRDAVGRIYIVDSELGTVFVFDENGEYDRALNRKHERLLDHPTWIALSEDGRTIYVADPPRKQIVELNREGEVNGAIDLPADFGGPLALSVVNNQIHVLGDRQHRVAIFSPGGRLEGELKWDGIQYPSASAWDPVRQLFFAVNPRWMIVQAFDVEGRNLGAFCQFGDSVDQARRIDLLSVDLEGLVYVVDSHEGKVLVFGGPGKH